MFTVKSFKKLLVAGLLTAGFLGVGLSHSKLAHAAVTNPAPRAQISFTFDDGPASNVTNVAPVLSKYGYTGTSYVITNCVGMTKTPNKCAADEDIPYMSWAQIKQLQNTYGWEIGSHSVSHPLMTEITAQKLETEVANSKAALVAQGFNPTAFATPYGDYNDKVLAAIAKYYTSHRGFADTGYNTWPYSNYLLRVQQVEYGVSIDTVKGYINQAIADHTWLILVFHEVRANPSSDVDDYQYATSDLDAIAAYAKQVGMPGTNITKGLVQGDTSDNLLTNPVNGTVIGNGWNTDVPANVSVDTKSNGSMPESTNSVMVKSGATTNGHIFSPKVSVNSNSQYVIKGYVNMASTQSGTLGFYVDEYDANGNWISGKYLQTIDTWYKRDISFAYTPSSSKVASVSLQIIVGAGSSTVAYIDSIQWLTTVSGQPVPPPTNLMSNGSFASGLTNWTTDSPSAITLDTTGKGSGSETANSVKLTSQATRNSQLFSGRVAVSAGNSYSMSANLNIANIGAGLGFYVDEYDANGNWISGKYLYTKQDAASGTVSFDYTPSSANVAKASLQVIVIAGNGTIVYIDDVRMTQN